MDPITIGLALASQFAPAVMKYFTNSDTAAAVAGHVIGIAQEVTGNATPAGAAAALQADPALALQFQTSVMANETKLQEMYLADVQGARVRDVEIVKVSGHNMRANALAGAACALVLICLGIVVWSTGIDEYAKGTITLVCGRALGWVEQIFSFEFGTTRANKTKDDTINNLTK